MSLDAVASLRLVSARAVIDGVALFLLKKLSTSKMMTFLVLSPLPPSPLPSGRFFRLL